MSQFEEIRKGSIEQPRSSSAHAYGSCVYAVMFSDGWLKVGRGKNPEARIQAHEAVSKMRGATRTAYVISGRIVNAKAAEAELIGFCQGIGKTEFGNEWFSGVEFNLVESLIKDRFPEDSAEAFDQEKERSEKAIDRVVGGMFRNGRQRNGVDLKWVEAMGHARIVERILATNEPLSGCWQKEVAPNFSFCALTVSLAVYEMDDEEITELYESLAYCPGDCLQSMESTVRAMIQSGKYWLGQGIAA